MTMSVGESYTEDYDSYLSLQEPKWEPDEVIEGMKDVPSDDQDVIRRSDGALEFLNDLLESVRDFVSEGQPLPEAKKYVDPLPVKACGAAKWRARTAAITANSNQPLLAHSKQRRRVTVWNHGPNDVFLSSITPSLVGFPAATPPPNVLRLPAITANVFPTLVIETTDDIYAICAAAQTAVLSISEEFDL